MRDIFLILTILTLPAGCIQPRSSHLDLVIETKEESEYSHCASDLDSLDGSEIFTIVDTNPEYKGGTARYLEALAKDIHIPEDQRKWQSVPVIFIIDTLGRVRYECLANRTSLDTLTDVEKEVLTTVKHHQEWIPGYQNGKKVPVKMRIKLMVGHRG